MPLIQTLTKPSLGIRYQVQSPEFSILTRIYDADVNLAVWQRQLSQHVDSYAHWLLNQPQAFAWQEIVDAKRVRQKTQETLPEHEYKHAFADDLAEIIDMFCCLFELNATGLRLRVLDKAMCPKFHSDRVPCRLITTYGGAGTEWRNGAYSEFTEQAHSDTIEQIADGHIALLKGDAWQGNEGQGLLHRSPALAVAQKRLLLTLDFG